jgi:hypothetical protein
MRAREALVAGGIFVAVVALVVGGVAVAGSLQAPPASPSSPPVETPQFDPGTERATPVPQSGALEMDAEASGKTVVIDAGHANTYPAERLQPLVATLTENGHEVQYVGGSGPAAGPGGFNESLRGADALVVVNPSRRYSTGQAAGVRAFAEAGGRVLVLSDPPQTRVSGGLFSVSTEQVGGKTTSLSSPLGIAFGSDHLYHTTRNANNYRAVYATPAGESDLAAGVDRVVLRGAAPVVSTGGETVLSAVEGTTVSSSRRGGTYAVAARVGNVTAVGDSEFFARETVYDADNEVLAGNVADFLVTGEKTANAPVPTTPGGPPGAPGPVRPGGPPAGPGTPPPTPSPSPSG